MLLSVSSLVSKRMITTQIFITDDFKNLAYVKVSSKSGSLVVLLKSYSYASPNHSNMGKSNKLKCAMCVILKGVGEISAFHSLSIPPS